METANLDNLEDILKRFEGKRVKLILDKGTKITENNLSKWIWINKSNNPRDYGVIEGILSDVTRWTREKLEVYGKTLSDYSFKIRGEEIIELRTY